MTTAVLEKIASHKTYPKLVNAFPPRAIRNEKELKECHEVIERLMAIDNPTQSQTEFLETLSTIVEAFESQKYPTPTGSTGSFLAHLIEAKGIQQSVIAEKTGISKSIISEVIAGKRGLSIENMKRLASYFGVPVSLFVECDRA